MTHKSEYITRFEEGEAALASLRAVVAEAPANAELAAAVAAMEATQWHWHSAAATAERLTAENARLLARISQLHEQLLTPAVEEALAREEEEGERLLALEEA